MGLSTGSSFLEEYAAFCGVKRWECKYIKCVEHIEKPYGC